MKPDFWFYLGDAQMKLNQPAAAEVSLQKFLETTTDPAAKAKALLALGETKIGAHKPDDAQKIADEIMTPATGGPGQRPGALAGRGRPDGASAI